MPPVLSRKRFHSDSPVPEPPPKRARTRKPTVGRNKESIFQTLDTPSRTKPTLSQTKAFLEQEDDESELSDSESSEDEFEDVPLASASKGKARKNMGEDNGSEESENENWEDALGTNTQSELDQGPTPVVSGDITLTLSAAPKAAFDSKPDGKKGPSKVQRQIRNVTHCMHVQLLMFHNLIRNGWIQDKEAQKILVESLSSGCWQEIERYWRDAGISDGPSRVVATSRKLPIPSKHTGSESGRWKESGKNGVKVYESPHTKRTTSRDDTIKVSKTKKTNTHEVERKTRDWGATSEPLEPNTPNLSAGDPLLRLLRYLSAYWKSRFTITVPSLRKRGYLSPSTLEAEINAFRDDPSHPEIFGERVESLEAFRHLAQQCTGSRDVGQQLFTALVRGLGIEARMVVSLQPVGFGWSQSEEGKAKNLDQLKELSLSKQKAVPVMTTPTKGKGKQARQATQHDIESSDSSDLSSVISISSDTDEEVRVKKSSKTPKHAEGLPYPTYWTEVISNLTHTPISVSPLPRAIIAGPSSPEKLAEFYARGAAADKARQVLAFLIAFSSDGTAKDVTTRYLPKRQWPGRTKGFRMPVERIPIHNKRGKVKRWEEWDWVKSLLRSYARPHEKRQPWDEVEDEGDLVPARAEKKKDMDEEGGKETLQGYKNSSEYVLERHLRREEALKPGAKIVRHFVTGKGENEKSEPVYRRKDIVNCKTAESWHKEGREIIPGEQPLKHVPMRAVTVTRKREIEERERVEGGKVQQGLYSRAQTDWIIPDPIVDGKIPRNAFNNIDVYVKTMVPKGAVHVPLKGTARICRKLDIDYAEACTGFEFGKQRAVPVLTGVVVAAENEDLLIDAWEAEEAKKAKKEADKREKLVLGLWKKFFSGLRIVERMRLEYGEDVELPVKTSGSLSEKEKISKSSGWEVFHQHKDFEGGFLRDDAGPSGNGQLHERPAEVQTDAEQEGGFLPEDHEEFMHDLTIDHGKQIAKDNTKVVDNVYRTPISLTSALQQPTDEVSNGYDGDEAFNSHKSHESHTSTDEEEEDQQPVAHPPLSARRKTLMTHKRTPKPPSGRTQKRKTVLHADSSDEETGPPPTNNLSSPPPTRSAPRRKAARKSDAKVKSHFFAPESEGETDLTDMTDRNSPVKKKEKESIGRGKGRGRGRGRGRGKA